MLGIKNSFELGTAIALVSVGTKKSPELSHITFLIRPKLKKALLRIRRKPEEKEDRIYRTFQNPKYKIWSLGIHDHSVNPV